MPYHRKNQTIIPPDNGWEGETCYQVEVKFNGANLQHYSIFYSGFLHTDNYPCGYNILFNPTYSRKYDISDVYYMKVLKKLDIKFGFSEEETPKNDQAT